MQSPEVYVTLGLKSLEPASIRQTLKLEFLLNLLAKTQPAEPAPRIIKS